MHSACVSAHNRTTRTIETSLRSNDFKIVPKILEIEHLNSSVHQDRKSAG